MSDHRPDDPDNSATPAGLDLEALAERIADRVAERLGGVTPRYLSVAEVSTYTGLSTDSVRALLASGRLTALRPVPGRVVIDRRELDSYVQASRGRPRRGRGRYERGTLDRERKERNEA
jgi:excisionase family DNA binding protein